MELREIIAKNICDLRTERGLTQLGLAEILNYSDKAISKWERAESTPDVFILKLIADYFGVSVDYLLTEEHKSEPASASSVPPRLSGRTHAIISFLSAALVWLLATCAFVMLDIAELTSHFQSWLVFIYAIPISCVVLLVFNSIWGKKRLNYIIISLVVWSLILSVFLTTLVIFGNNIWILFLVGIPAELIIVLWSGMGFRGFSRRRKKCSEKEDV